ncbi:MAG: hypothetical protein AAF492_32385, partial [Verrucomicrobiota bacterium]
MKQIGYIFFFSFLFRVTGPAQLEIGGRVIDVDSEKPLAVRLYIEDAEGKYYLAESEGGQAVPYEKLRGESSEVHTCLSAHPFVCKVPPGRYSLTVERGKSWLPETMTIELQDRSVDLTLKLKQWIDLEQMGWYSGDTHTHRLISELPTILLADNLNVALPLTHWVTDTQQTPDRNIRYPEPIPPAQLIEVDKTHVIWPLNTEYEIFSVAGKQHTLGAVFVLNHREPFKIPAPPVGAIAREARRQNALLDLDKHNWPWSMMLMPIMNVDLFELTNNHIWRSR